MTGNGSLLDTIFEYVGGKLKSLAKFFFVVGISASIILGIVMFVNAGNASEMSYIGESMSGFYTTFGFIILIGGTIMTVLFSFVLYAFGSIAEKYLNEKEEKETDKKTRNAYNAQRPYYQNTSPIYNNYWTCPKCGMLISNSTKVCGNCGTVKARNAYNNTQEAVLKPGDWVCPKCGKVNSAYVGTCGCGGTKIIYEDTSVSEQDQDKTIGILNQMLANGQITQEEFEKRYSEITGENSEQDLPKVCPQCNTELKEGAVFCQKCGTKVN